MNAQSSGRRARVIFAAALLVIAFGLAAWGWLRLNWSTPTPPELENQGYIMVYTSDPDASVSFEIDDLSNPDASPREYWVNVSGDVASAKTAVWWAVALGGDARFPPGEAPVSGTLPNSYPSPDRPRGFGYMDDYREEPTYFVNGVEWPGRAETDEDTGSVIFGRLPNHRSINLTVKVRGPLLEDIGEYLTLSTPTLGRNGFNPSQIGGEIDGRENPRQFYNHEADKDLLEDLDRAWHEPKVLQVGFDAQYYPQFEGARQEEGGTAPVAPFVKRWQAKDTLKVEASFRRPAEAAKNERLVFFAGVLVSLAASFLVWGLELLFGPERDPVAARRRRP
jgi:hypothetical protein